MVYRIHVLLSILRETDKQKIKMLTFLFLTETFWFDRPFKYSRRFEECCNLRIVRRNYEKGYCKFIDNIYFSGVMYAYHICINDCTGISYRRLQIGNSIFVRQHLKHHIIQCPPKVLEQNKYFLTILKHVLILTALHKQYGSKIRPNETLGLIFDPYCLIPSISFC